MSKRECYEKIIDTLILDNNILDGNDWATMGFEVLFMPKDPDEFQLYIDDIADFWTKPYLGEGDYIEEMFITNEENVDKKFLNLYYKAIKNYNKKGNVKK